MPFTAGAAATAQAVGSMACGGLAPCRRGPVLHSWLSPTARCVLSIRRGQSTMRSRITMSICLVLTLRHHGLRHSLGADVARCGRPWQRAVRFFTYIYVSMMYVWRVVQRHLKRFRRSALRLRACRDAGLEIAAALQAASVGAPIPPPKTALAAWGVMQEDMAKPGFGASTLQKA
jgi:hypothetical protein